MPSDNPLLKLRTAIKSRKKSVNVVPDEERSITITFRVSPAERERLESRCEGILQSDYIRARLFDYPLPRRKAVMSETLRSVRFELKRLVTSIVQQQKAIEQAITLGVQPLGKDVKAYHKELFAITKLVNQIRLSLDECVLGVSSEDYSNDSSADE